MFERVLIANRGEIALRIHRTCREMGIRTVAVHSTADAEAMHVRFADQAICIGPPAAQESYLNIPAILSAAIISGSEAIHPGIGFLSENARFAEMVVAHNLAWIGPSPDHIRSMGNKINAKSTMIALGLPVIPGFDGPLTSLEQAHSAAAEIGYPVLIKAASGGGGRGMRVAANAETLKEAYQEARTEALAGFGDDTVYMERYLSHPRHIEIQMLADSHGNCVHLGERDCSVQRRHQKLIEEVPSTALNEDERTKIGELCVNSMQKLGYCSVGTLEFLYQDGEFYFMEMNTRLQIEHTITETVTGIDLVREQIGIAAGLPLSMTQSEIRFHGHVIECRINAENAHNFRPSPGLVTNFHPPGGYGVRVDSALFAGYTVPSYYDSMIAKLIVNGHTRNEALMRLKRALEEFIIDGIETNLELYKIVLNETAFIDGSYDIRWLEALLAQKKD